MSAMVGMRARRLRVFGPPGTGKTTWLQEQVQRLIESGVSGEEIAVASFTRAAFWEFGRRLAGQIPTQNLGTVHSLAYRAIGKPDLALTSGAVRRWNESVPAEWHITPRITDPNETVEGAGNDLGLVSDLGTESGGEAKPGDRIYDLVTNLRNRRVPTHEWPREALIFWSEWRSWMAREGLVDFPGMLEEAIHAPSPGVQFLFIDEAQDLTPLQRELVERWSREAEFVAFLGDDDQAIYGFMGADAANFLSIPVDEEIVLEQSWRIPARVQALAEEIASRISQRVPKRYRPRPEAGEVRFGGAGLGGLYWAIEDALNRVEAGDTVLFLATARHILGPLKRALKEMGVPYGNPYAPHRAELGVFPEGRMGRPPAWEAVRSFLHPRPHGVDIKAWARHLAPWVFQGGDRDGALRQIANLNNRDPIGEGHPIFEVFAPEHRPYIIARDPRWFLNNVHAHVPQAVRDALTIAIHDPEAVLEAKPRVWVGTVHSVKGGEADWIYLLSGYTREAARAHPDTLHRVMYVAVTRARKGVILLGRGRAPYGYPWPQGVGGGDGDGGDDDGARAD